MKILKEKKRKYVIAWYFYLGNIKYIFIQGKKFKYKKNILLSIFYFHQNLYFSFLVHKNFYLNFHLYNLFN